MYKKTIAIILTVITLLILTSSIPPARAQFVLASWDYPDEYGQGISGFTLFGNSTGSWVQVGDYHSWTEAHVYDWNVSVAIKLRCYTNFNSTLTGASSTTEGKNYQRHNVTVTDSNDAIVFSQNNFTYTGVSTVFAPMWLYDYEVVLNFLPDYGQVYTVTVTYEVFW